MLIQVFMIIICETWLCEQYSNEELGLNNFHIYCADRNSNTSDKITGGGVLIAVRKNLSSSMVFTGQEVESVFVRLRINDKNILVGGLYIPPNSDGAIYKSHCRDLEIIFNRFIDSDFIIAGDFNLPKVNWNDDFNLIRSKCENFEILMSTYSFLNLNQVNKYPNNRNVFLDLV